MSKKHLVVGIDLGTTYSAVAAFNKFEEKAEILCNMQEKKDATTPSVVSVRFGKVIVGESARSNLAYDPANTVIEIKREMGEEFRPETLDKFGGREAGYRVRDPEKGIDGDPVRVKFADQWFMPQEISAFVLMKMKQIAEADLGEEVRDAVITVPAYFTEKQRKATEEAALLAGLYPRQLLAEPTAAAICYGVDRVDAERKVYLIYDLGGGTFDVSIITVEGSKIEVIATSGDPRLGGGDFDDLITAWAVDELKRRHKLDVSGVPTKRAVIKYYAEKLKRELSTFKTAKMQFPELRPDNPPNLELSRADFERMIEPLLNKSLSYVDQALNMAEQKGGLKRDQIDAILLVGGSSKIPRVKAKLLDYFQKEESFVRDDCDPDAVVARGAALVALGFQPSPPPFDIGRKTMGGINRTADAELPAIQLITEHSLGVGVQDNLFHPIIRQGARIPTQIMDPNFTNGDSYRTVDVRVYQGEGKFVFENTLIGTLELGPMEPRERGFHKFEVTFSLDVNGLLSMMVHHVNEGKKFHGKFEQKTGVGGAAAMATIREKLLKMFDATLVRGVPTPPEPPNIRRPVDGPMPPAATSPAQPTAGPASTVPLAPPPAMTAAPASATAPPAAPPIMPPPAPIAPPSMSAPGQPAPPSMAAAAPVAVAPAPSSAAPGQPVPPVAVSVAPPAAQPAPSVPTAPSPAPPPYAAPAAAGAGLLALAGEAPGEHKSILRRAEKLLRRESHPGLLAKYNELVTAINTGQSADELDDLSDELENLYHDSREKSPA